MKRVNISNFDFEQLDELIPYIRQQKCILFIGAGLSQIAGGYDWDLLINRLKSITEKLAKINGGFQEVPKLKREDIIEYCFEKLRSCGQEKEFEGVVMESILPAPAFENKYSSLIRKIERINPFPKVILTTNIDDNLERVKIAGLDFSDAYYKIPELTISNLRKGGIFHIHGFRNNLEDAILRKSQYLKRYRNSDFRKFLKQVFINYRILFIGSSLEDSISNILQDWRNSVPNEFRHFALLPKDEISHYQLQEDISLKLHKVQLINYGPKEIFSDFLTGWIDRNFSKKLKIEKESAHAQ